MVYLIDRFGNNYRMQSGDGPDEHSMSLYHNYCKKWSLFIGIILHNELLRLKLHHMYEITDNASVLKFRTHEAMQLGLL